MNYVDPSGYYTVGLRDSLSSADYISWNDDTRTATATINGITQSFAVDSDSNVWIENGRVKMDSSYFYWKFGSVSKVYSDYLTSHSEEIGYAKDDPVGNFIIDTVATGGVGALRYLGTKAITNTATTTSRYLLKMNLHLFGKGKFPSGAVSGKEVIRFLQKEGFEVMRVKGSHYWLKGPNGNVLPIPLHGNQSLAKGTLESIKKLAGY